MQYKIGMYIRSAQENDASVEDQRKKLLDIVALKNKDNSQWGEVVDTYIDNGVSGTRMDRPGLNKMLEDVRSGKVNAILTKDYTRFSRTLTHVMSLIETLKSYKVALYTLDELTREPRLGKRRYVTLKMRIEIERPRVQKNKNQTRANTGTDG